MISHRNAFSKIRNIINSIESRLPSVWNIENIKLMYPVDYTESLNTTLVLEIKLLNALLNKMKTSIEKAKQVLNNEI